MKKSSSPEKGASQSSDFKKQSEAFIRDKLQMNEFADKCFSGSFIQNYFSEQDASKVLNENDKRFPISQKEQKFLEKVDQLVKLDVQEGTLSDEDAKMLKLLTYETYRQGINNIYVRAVQTLGANEDLKKDLKELRDSVDAVNLDWFRGFNISAISPKVLNELIKNHPIKSLTEIYQLQRSKKTHSGDENVRPTVVVPIQNMQTEIMQLAEQNEPVATKNYRVAEIIATKDIEQRDIIDLIRWHYLPVLDRKSREYKETFNLFVEITKNIEELKAHSDLDSDSTISPMISPAESPSISPVTIASTDNEGSDNDNDELVLDEDKAAQKIQAASRQKVARDPNETDSSMAQEGVREEQKGPQFSLKKKGTPREAIQVMGIDSKTLYINVNSIKKITGIELKQKDKESIKDFLIKAAYIANKKPMSNYQSNIKVLTALRSVWYDLPREIKENYATQLDSKVGIGNPAPKVVKPSAQKQRSKMKRRRSGRIKRKSKAKKQQWLKELPPKLDVLFSNDEAQDQISVDRYLLVINEISWDRIKTREQLLKKLNGMGDKNGRSTLEKLENFIDNENTLNSAATKIQALQRGRSDRANVKNQAKAATKIQAILRGRKDQLVVKKITSQLVIASRPNHLGFTGPLPLIGPVAEVMNPEVSTVLNKAASTALGAETVTVAINPTEGTVNICGINFVLDQLKTILNNHKDILAKSLEGVNGGDEMLKGIMGSFNLEIPANIFQSIMEGLAQNIPEVGLSIDSPNRSIRVIEDPTSHNIKERYKKNDRVFFIDDWNKPDDHAELRNLSNWDYGASHNLIKVLQAHRVPVDQYGHMDNLMKLTDGVIDLSKIQESSSSAIVVSNKGQNCALKLNNSPVMSVNAGQSLTSQQFLQVVKLHRAWIVKRHRAWRMSKIPERPMDTLVRMNAEGKVDSILRDGVNISTGALPLNDISPRDIKNSNQERQGRLSAISSSARSASSGGGSTDSALTISAGPDVTLDHTATDRALTISAGPNFKLEPSARGGASGSYLKLDYKLSKVGGFLAKEDLFADLSVGNIGIDNDIKKILLQFSGLSGMSGEDSSVHLEGLKAELHEKKPKVDHSKLDRLAEKWMNKIKGDTDLEIREQAKKLDNVIEERNSYGQVTNLKTSEESPDLAEKMMDRYLQNNCEGPIEINTESEQMIQGVLKSLLKYKATNGDIPSFNINSSCKNDYQNQIDALSSGDIRDNIDPLDFVEKGWSQSFGRSP